MIRTLTKYSSLCILLLFSFVFTSCLDSSDSNTQTRSDLLETAKEVTQGQNGDRVLTSFVDLLEQTNLDSTIANEGPFTAIMPVDSAFDALPGGGIGSFGPDAFENIVQYHIVDGIVSLNQLPQQDRIESLQGEDLFFEIRSNQTGTSNRVFVNGGRLLGRIDASNGIIYVINKVLFPDAYLKVPGLIEKRYKLNKLTESIKDADLADALSDTSKGFTVFAPTDDAVGDTTLTADQLQYHVIPEKLISRDLNSQTYTTLSGQELTVEINGTTVTVNGNATVTTADIEGTNGVIHIIDGVLSPSE